MTLGDFAIVGVTGTQYKPYNVKYLVNGADDADNLINFTGHTSYGVNPNSSSSASSPDVLVSGIVLLAQSYKFCTISMGTSFKVYQFANNLTDISNPRFVKNSTVLNSTCITKGTGSEGYKEKSALKYQKLATQRQLLTHEVEEFCT